MDLMNAQQEITRLQTENEQLRLENLQLKDTVNALEIEILSLEGDLDDC